MLERVFEPEVYKVVPLECIKTLTQTTNTHTHKVAVLQRMQLPLKRLLVRCV